MSDSGLANWTCVCGRHASIDHSIGGYCHAREKIEKLQSQLALAREVLGQGLERMKLINGPEEDCIIQDWKSCANHTWIRRAKKTLEELNGKAGEGR